MKRLLIIAGLVLLGAALVFLNQGVRKSAMPDNDEDEQAQQAKAQQAQKTPTPAAPTDPKSVLPAEETVGDPSTVKHHITVGWVYDEANQQKPETLTIPLQAIRDYVRQSGGTVTAEVVDLDVPVEDRSPPAQAVTDLGIRVDGRPLFSGNVSQLPFPPDQMKQVIESVISKK